MDLQLTAIVATVWIATGLTRFIMMRPVSKKFNNTVYRLYLDIGIPEEELVSSHYMLAMRIATYFEFISDIALAPYYLLRDRTSFFSPVDDSQIHERAVETFRRSIHTHGEHVEMLQAYEAMLEREIAEEKRNATHH